MVSAEWRLICLDIDMSGTRCATSKLHFHEVHLSFNWCPHNDTCLSLKADTKSVDLKTLQIILFNTLILFERPRDHILPISSQCMPTKVVSYET